MCKNSYKDFKKTWLLTYIKQNKQGDCKTRRAIKDNIYKNIHLTENEKDKLWEEIVNRGGIL